jgi:hypothetical protein
VTREAMAHSASSSAFWRCAPTLMTTSDGRDVNR